MFTLTDVHNIVGSMNLTPWMSGRQSGPSQSTTDTSGWTTSFLGFSEREFMVDNQDRLEDVNAEIARRLNYDNGILRTDGGEYMAGFMVAHTVSEIRQMISDVSSQLPKGVPKGKIVTGGDMKPFGVYQVPALFNGLERTDNPLLGITDYIFDSSSKQVLRCTPGALVRNYHNHSFNALSNLGISLVDGCLIWEKDPKPIIDRVKSHGDLIKIPTMLYTQAAGVSFDGSKVDYDIRNKVVHQILGSSAGYNKSGNGGAGRVQLELIKEIVKYEYIGAIGMGLLLHWMDSKVTNNKIPTIGIKLLGLKEFNNPIIDIISALREAIAEFSQFDFQLDIVDESGISNDYLLSKLGVNSIIYSEIVLNNPKLPPLHKGYVEFKLEITTRPPTNKLDDIKYTTTDILKEEYKVYQDYLRLKIDMSGVRPVRANHEQYRAYTYLKLASNALSKGATYSQILDAVKLKRYNLPVDIQDFIGISKLKTPNSDNILVMSVNKITGGTLIGKPSINMLPLVNEIYNNVDSTGTVSVTNSSSRLVSFTYDKYITNRLVPIFRFYDSDKEYYIIDSDLHGNIDDPLRVIGWYDQNILYNPYGEPIRSIVDAQFI